MKTEEACFCGLYIIRIMKIAALHVNAFRRSSPGAFRSHVAVPTAATDHQEKSQVVETADQATTEALASWPQAKAADVVVNKQQGEDDVTRDWKRVVRVACAG